MTIDKILVAADYSERNKFVYNSAVSLAKSTGATLMLLHVLSEDESDYSMLPTYAEYYPVLEDREYELYQERLAEYQERGIDLLQNLTQEATAAGIKTEHTQLSGNPGRMICELADIWGADLILVGSRGLKGLKEVFLGSVSNYVTHHAPCSVLIVREAVDNSKDLNASKQESWATIVDS